MTRLCAHRTERDTNKRYTLIQQSRDKVIKDNIDVKHTLRKSMDITLENSGFSKIYWSKTFQV